VDTLKEKVPKAKKAGSPEEKVTTFQRNPVTTSAAKNAK
jgi:hypothetical protein